MLADLKRMLALPQERMTPTQEMTALTKAKGGTMTLKPKQAEALWQALNENGLYAPLSVGSGKTILALILPTLIEAKTPLILTRAALIKQMMRDAEILKADWQIRSDLHFCAYEWLSMPKYVNYLSELQPDMIVADEAQRIANTHSVHGKVASARAQRNWVLHP